METRANPLGWPVWAWRSLPVPATVLAAYGLAQGLEQWARFADPSSGDVLVRAIADAGGRATFAMFGATCLATLMIGLFVLLRSRQNSAAVLLAMVLLAWAPSATFLPPPWAYPGPNASYYLRWLADFTRLASISLFWPLFCLVVSGGSTSQRQVRRVTIIAFVVAAWSLTLGVALMIDPALFNTSHGAAVIWGNFAATHGTGFAILLWNYRRNDASSRNRVKIVILAFVAYVLSWLLTARMVSFLQLGESEWGLRLAVGSTAIGVLAVALVAYAVLRRRLFDLDFAINRTLVYGTISFVLLAGFGIAKWAIEHLIPESWHEGSEYYSFGIALLLFLSLHRVHNWVEHNVERVFFRRWHDNEAELRRFVTSAGHFDQAPVLCRAFAQELTRFAGGAEAALYLRGGDGSYRMECGGLAGAPSDYGEDHPAFALMKAERRPIELAGAADSLPGAMALPMLDHGVLAGFVLLARKPDGTAFRPDETDVLGWAAHQVGLDLQALQARELRAEVAILREQLTRREKRKRTRAAPRLAAVSGGGAA